MYFSLISHIQVFFLFNFLRGKTTKEKLKNQNFTPKIGYENVKWWKRKSVKAFLSFSMILSKSEAEYLSNYDIIQKMLSNPNNGSITSRGLLNSSALDLL